MYLLSRRKGNSNLQRDIRSGIDQTTKSYTQWATTQNLNHHLRLLPRSHGEKQEAGVEKPQGDLQIPFFNILLTGQIGSGKSSFYNSLNSVFHQRVVPYYNRAYSLTNDYRVYEVRLGTYVPPLPFRICDTMGLNHEDPNELDIRNILKAVDGHVPDRFVFDKERELVADTPGYINTPSLQDKAHCVAVVIDAEKAKVMENIIRDKLKNLRKDLIDKKIPTYILLTHIDQACAEVNRDVTKVYHSIAIRDLVTKVGKCLHGLPENQIFPVMNYKDQNKMNDNMDILLLTALRQMLYSAQGYLEKKM